MLTSWWYFDVEDFALVISDVSDNVKHLPCRSDAVFDVRGPSGRSLDPEIPGDSRSVVNPRDHSHAIQREETAKAECQTVVAGAGADEEAGGEPRRVQIAVNGFFEVILSCPLSNAATSISSRERDVLAGIVSPRPDGDVAQIGSRISPQRVYELTSSGFASFSGGGVSSPPNR